MSKREQIMKTTLRALNLTDLKAILEIEPDQTFEVERFVFSGTKAYIQVNLLDRILRAEIPEDQLAFILHEIEMIDDYDITSFEVYFRDWNYTKEDYDLRWASLEGFFNALNTEIVQEILIAYAENNLCDGKC